MIGVAPFSWTLVVVVGGIPNLELTRFRGHPTAFAERRSDAEDTSPLLGDSVANRDRKRPPTTADDATTDVPFDPIANLLQEARDATNE